MSACDETAPSTKRRSPGLDGICVSDSDKSSSDILEARSRRQLLQESWYRFVEAVPEMRQPWCATLVWGGGAFAAAICLWFGWMLARALPYGALLAQSLFVLWAGLGVYGGFWRHRAAYRERYAALAYRQLFFRFLAPGLVGGVAAIYFPLLVGGERLLPPAVAYSLAAYLLATAGLIEVRGKEIFWDIEWRSFVYNVFPERGRVVTSGIFHWLRHPVYSAAIRFVFATALVRNNWSALACATMISAALWFLGSVEARDLTERDAGYATYRRSVPAFFSVHPLRFWRFLLAGKEAD